MQNLKEKIKIIDTLILDDTPQSLVYAALECRLAIELICYERLKVSIDKMSKNEVDWQPKKVIRQILAEENSHATQELTLSISTEPNKESNSKPSLEEYKAKSYVKLGTQSELNINKLARYYQALSNLALHVSVPKNQTIQTYGDAKIIKRKLGEALVQLRAVSNGNLVLGGIGPEYKFQCLTCNSLIIRKVSSLHDGKIVHCNSCIESYLISISDEEIFHSQNVYAIPCDACSTTSLVPKNIFKNMSVEECHELKCDGCNKTLYVKLMPTMYKCRE
ncbi:hypothetical protein FCV43_19060 [Vibrio genomosp. F6]|uniref:hypothetical protein n=1 Tax=Vibrio genomosp. F6 TaxID=723172 RepID=UPI0010BD220A|nr:hypothetical protein [Vibrio genomosp. F6]TKF15185.1 hypothetical protein FCV43_19060 [Vibrio genomosp. F6]